MPFDTTERYFAFPQTLLANADKVRTVYGSFGNTAPTADGKRKKTLLCGLDNHDTGKLRALVLGVDAIPIPLSDGRLFLSGYWSDKVIAAFESGEIEGEELTIEEVKSLMPVSEL